MGFLVLSAGTSAGVSFSSLRADRITGPLLSLLSRSDLKVQPLPQDIERLRRVINKGLTEKDLLTAAVNLVEAWDYHLKLYVMIGLPTETEEDLAEMTTLIRRLRQEILPIGRGSEDSVSELLPRLQVESPTPFQSPDGGLDPENGNAEA